MKGRFRGRWRRVVLTVAATCLGLTTFATRAEESGSQPLTTLASIVVGDWSRVPVPPLVDFPPAALDVALRACDPANPLLLRFRRAGQALLQEEGGAKLSAIVSARTGGDRSGFTSWLVLTDAGPEALLLGSRNFDGVDRALLMTDSGTFVQCRRERTDGKKEG